MIWSEIKRVQDAGLDPNRYIVERYGEGLSLTHCKRFCQRLGQECGHLGSSGLAMLLPDRMTNVDVGEIAPGKPFGSNSAIVPQVRELVLDGDNGTIANIIRDPWKCATFQRKC